MTNTITAKRYDLEDRTFTYAKEVIQFCRSVPKSTITFSLIDQLVRSAGSVGANYIEANEALSKKDFSHRIKICRKEAKESRYWLQLLGNRENGSVCTRLEVEATELIKIFSSILSKSLQH